MNTFSDLNFEWIPLQKYVKSDLNSAQEELHLAFQFIAIAGKYLLPTRADDGHTNAGWDEATNSFFSRTISGRLRVALYAAAFQLQVLSADGEVLYRLRLDNKTVFECFLWLKELFRQEDVKTHDLSLELHYELSKKFDKDHRFTMPSFELLKELSFHRTNTDRVLRSLSGSDKDPEIRTWPHHFDHARTIPLAKTEKNEVIHSLTTGYAVCDEWSDEPYLYVRPWKKDGHTDIKGQPDVGAGQWIGNDLNAAVLPFGVIIESEKQGERVSEFMTKALKLCRDA